MIIKEAEFKECKECGSRERLSDDKYGCDNCGKPTENVSNLLRLTVFNHNTVGNNENEHLEFCSWKCCLQKLKSVKTNYFVNLPYLHFDECEVEGISVQDFLACIDWEKVNK